MKLTSMLVVVLLLVFAQTAPAATRLCWRAESVSPDIRPMLRSLGEEYPIREMQNGAPRDGEVSLQVEQDAGMAGCSVRLNGDKAVIRYAKLSHAGRALGTLLAGLVQELPV